MFVCMYISLDCIQYVADFCQAYIPYVRVYYQQRF